jgi:hypothetical protein
MNETTQTVDPKSQVLIVTSREMAPMTSPGVPSDVGTVVISGPHSASQFSFFGTRIRETVEAFKEAF